MWILQDFCILAIEVAMVVYLGAPAQSLSV
jgi:hypothetical protein